MLITQNFECVPVGEYDRLSYTQKGVYIDIEGVGGKLKVVGSVGAPSSWGHRHLTTDNQNCMSDNRPYIRIRVYKEIGRLNDDDIGVHQLQVAVTTSARTPDLWPWGEMYAGGDYSDLEQEFKPGKPPHLYPNWPTWPHNKSFTFAWAYGVIAGGADIGVIVSAELYDCDVDNIGFVK